MPLDPAEFLRVAEHLEVSPATSAPDGSLRTAVGRLYYASYLMTRQTLREIKGDSLYNLGHASLIDFLKRQSPQPVKVIGHGLATLRSHRNKADYVIADSLRLSQIEMLKQTAKGIVSAQVNLTSNVRARDLPPHEPPHGH